MSEPEFKFEIDEYGRIGYRVTNEGVLLSKDEKEFIIDCVTRMQAENAKLRELLQRLLTEYRYMRVRPRAVYLQHEERMRAIEEEMRELGVEL